MKGRLLFPALALLILLGGCATASPPENVAPGLTAQGPYLLTGPRNLWRDYSSRDDRGRVQAVIEIPTGTNAKWEVLEEDGTLRWEQKDGKPRVVRYLGYVGNYGMIPQTLLPEEEGGDGDPLDILVLGPAVPRGSVVPVKVIGMLRLIDSGEQDDKLIALPAENSVMTADSVEELDRNYPGTLKIIETWFENYKGPGKMVSKGWAGPEETRARLEIAISAYRSHSGR